ncbi:MAG: ROK family protein [Abditibacteriales bacterium]|nr:ROK family protein [Abditibacteriales bacterium]MDW8367196.1 ROK family protein [Abditibacteriales bacterium]
MPSELYAVGVDVGGTKFAAGLVHHDGRLVGRVLSDETRRFSGPRELLRRIAQVAQEVAAGVPSGGEVACVGVGVPGPIKDNVCLFAPNVRGWAARPVPVGKMLAEHLPLPVHVINDGNAAAFAEFWCGAGKRCTDILMLTLGTGIGGGIVCNGQLLTGSTGVVAEAGHVTVDPNGPPCGCGKCGCLEAFCGLNGIIERATRLLLRAGRANDLLQLVDWEDVTATPRLLKEAADAGDAVAQQVFSETAAYLAKGIESMALLLDPDRVIIGGGIARAGRYIFDPLRRALQASPLNPRMKFKPQNVVPAQLGNDAGIVGAAAWAFDRCGIQRKR